MSYKIPLNSIYSLTLSTTFAVGLAILNFVERMPHGKEFFVSLLAYLLEWTTGIGAVSGATGFRPVYFVDETLLRSFMFRTALLIGAAALMLAVASRNHAEHHSISSIALITPLLITVFISPLAAVIAGGITILVVTFTRPLRQ